MTRFIGYFLKKAAWPMLLTILIVLLSTPVRTSGVSQASKTFSSFGTISYSISGALPLTGLGGDYLVHYDDGSPERWITKGIIDILAQWKPYGYHTSRLGFEFADSNILPKGEHGCSVYDPVKMDRVLEIFDSIGVKVILVLQNNYDMQNDFGSWKWVNNWKELAQRYKGDKRIAAFSIASEPEHKSSYDTWATDGPLGAITDRLKLQQVFAYLVREIHKIDPDRVVIFPYPGFQYSNYNEWFADLQKTGILSELNVVYDVCHPYFFENDWDMGMTPEQKAEWYANKQIIPSVNFFGAEKCWIGETFCFKGYTQATSSTPSHPATHDLQVRWLTALINQCVKYRVGFDIWNVAFYLRGPTSPYKCWDEEAMLASNYKP